MPPGKAAAAADKGSAPANALDYAYTLHQIDIADLNGNGLQDITVAAHVESRVETYYQTEPRTFAPSGPLPNVGFHPNGTTTVSGVAGPTGTLLVLNAEAANALRVYRPETGQPAELLGEVPVPAPDHSAVVEWSDWGETVIVTQKMGADLHLIPGLSSFPDRPQSPTTVSLVDRPRRVAGLAVADLDGDGVSTVVATIPNEGKLLGIAPAGPAGVEAKPIRSFDRRQRVHLVLPIRFDADETDDLFVLGETSPIVHLLLGNGDHQQFELTDDGVLAAQLSREANDRLALWAASEKALHVVVWSAQRTNPPDHHVLPHPGLDHVRLAIADLDADGADDLVVGSSVGAVPLSVIYGPLLPQVDGIRQWLSRLAAQHEES